MCPDIELDDPGFLYHTTMQLTKKKLEDYEEGKVYRVTLVLRKLHNPLEYIAEHPMNADGTEIMTSRAQGYPHPSITPGKFQPYAEVGYFNGADAQARFTTPKQYTGGNGHTWHLPSETELRSIFGSVEGSLVNSLHHIRELVQIGQHYKGLVNSSYHIASDGAIVGSHFFSNTPLSPENEDIEDVYNPLFHHNNLSDKKMYYRDQTTTPEYPLEISNRRHFAFRYKYNDADRTLSMTAKYVGYNERRGGAIDLKSKPKAWWTDPNSMTRTFPAYGVDTNNNDYNYDPAKSLYSQYPSAGGMRTGGLASLIFNTQNTLKMLISTAPKQREWKMPVYLFRTID